MLAMHQDDVILLGDAVIAVKDDTGRVRLHQLTNLTAAGRCRRVLGHAGRPYLRDAAGQDGSRCSIRGARLQADRCRHQ